MDVIYAGALRSIDDIQYPVPFAKRADLPYGQDPGTNIGSMRHDDRPRFRPDMTFDLLKKIRILRRRVDRIIGHAAKRA